VYTSERRREHARLRRRLDVIGPDLVRVRKKSGALALAKPSKEAAERAQALAEQVLLVLASNVNESRAVVEEALNELESTPKKRSC